MDDAFGSKTMGGFGDDDDPRHDDCPICRGDELSPDVVEWLKEMVAASEAEPGQSMSAEEAIAFFQNL